MANSTLEDWLAHIETLHCREIDLGLDRVTAVLQRLGLQRPGFTTVAIGGTNGKGSTVAMLESVYETAGFRSGAFTSPHLWRFNERIRVASRPVGDDALVAAFEAVETVRGTVSLTYFEYATLAALYLFDRESVEIALLEVGMGGRLDAVNAVDIDAALVTSVAVDHRQWLGEDREAIGLEKAGIFRGDRPAVVGDPDAPSSLLEYGRRIGAQLLCAGTDFHVHERAQGLEYRSRRSRYGSLPATPLTTIARGANLGAVLAMLDALAERWPVEEDAVRAGLESARLPGRFQELQPETPGPAWILDVAHNPAAAGELARRLRDDPVAGRTIAILGLLDDKDATGVIGALADVVDHWYLASLPGPRGLTAVQLAGVCEALNVAPTRCFGTVEEACREASLAAGSTDRVVAFGSFMVVAPAVDAVELYCAASSARTR